MLLQCSNVCSCVRWSSQWREGEQWNLAPPAPTLLSFTWITRDAIPASLHAFRRLNVIYLCGSSPIQPYHLIVQGPTSRVTTKDPCQLVSNFELEDGSTTSTICFSTPLSTPHTAIPSGPGIILKQDRHDQTMVVSCSGQPALTPHPEPSVLTTLGCCAEEKCVTCVRYLESHTAAIYAYYLCILFIHELILH